MLIELSFLVLMIKANLVKFNYFPKFWTFWMERRPSKSENYTVNVGVFLYNIALVM